MRYFRHYSILAVIVCILSSCAKRGTINGGLKDTLAPVIKMSFPKNYSTGFTGKEIRLEFDEYVKLKDVNKQLIVSPPLKRAAEISPLTASKTITIRISDTLQPNTTYSLNFGQSIQDNNEGNPLPQFKYVFSTGTFIDSLTLGGQIKDAIANKPDNFVSVMLYEWDENYNDSLIYKENPRYVTNTLDSAKSFKFENLRAGKYKLIALKDIAGNNKFDPNTDKIGFHKTPVTVPSDTLYELELFREDVRFKALKPTLDTGSKLILGYQGNPENATVSIQNGQENVPAAVTRISGKDSLNIWFRPVKTDSLSVRVTNDNYTETFNVKVKPQKLDTLNFSAKYPQVLPLREPFQLTASRPLIAFDPAKITLVSKDSIAIPITTRYVDSTMALTIDFTREPLQQYKLTMLPGAVTDFYNVPNDTLRYSFSTKNTSDYGNLRLTLENIRRFPIIVQLTNAKGVVMASQYSVDTTKIDFTGLDPALYTLRIIYDDNKNKRWDSGSFLEQRQTEEVIYFPKEIDVRANWDVDQPFTLP